MFGKLSLAPVFRGTAIRFEFFVPGRVFSLGGCPPKRPPPGVVCPPKCAPAKPKCGPAKAKCVTPKLKTVEPQIVIPRKDCSQGPIPANPCCPHFPKGNYKKFRNIFLFFCLPIIVLQSLRLMCHQPEHKKPCYEYEYMLRRTKRFPWGDGVKSLFHNDHTNHLPGECLSHPPARSAECD